MLFFFISVHERILTEKESINMYQQQLFSTLIIIRTIIKNEVPKIMIFLIILIIHVYLYMCMHAVSHRSEYTPHVFVNILLYLFI